MEATKAKIRTLLKERKAILLAHNYVLPEVQDVADLCGDSLELSIKAAATEAEVIVFCGVHFMAETASILSPEKTVLLPVTSAGCPMADMVTPLSLAARKAELPGVPVVTYVNSSAAVKALSDVCCTSANVIKVVRSLSEKEVLMTPDRNLAQYAASKTDKTVHLWEGYCPFHNTLTAQTALAVKAKYPGAIFMAHPECSPEVLAVADVVTSTSGMLGYAQESSADTFIVGTEVGILYPLSQQNPEKTFIPASLEMCCTDMKRIRLDDIVTCLTNLSGEVKVPEEIRLPALSAVQKMVAMK
ncbi:quinolinate synthase NadA [Desulfoluna sp.]|uniref:quinolinate synthase NadA n=1 Tax=Desulfoluna sp. TaxID=2045199 RepID=UPI00261A26B7|nr:quinolinate synthase NadA [Desulfoluna sp.]